MKIIKPGNIGKKWSIQHGCTGWGNKGTGCDALLELEFEDLRYFPGVPGDSWGSRDPAVSFKCPCCGKLTDLGMQDWPTGYHDLPRWTKEWQDAKPDAA
jgi:hypothetical protein